MISEAADAGPPHVVAVSGSSGLIGSAVVAALSEQGRTIRPLVRGTARTADEIAWFPDSGRIDMARLEGLDAVVHLAGEPLDQRWTEDRKRRIRESRVQGTETLAEALSLLQRPPSVLVCASAVGYYGDRGDEVLTEESPPGHDFLADVVGDWEAATAPAKQQGIRVVHLRFGVVLSREGGALARMLTPFRLGIGGRMGSGRQWMSWVSLPDVVGIIAFVLDRPLLHGPINAVAPGNVTNAEFTRELGAALGRPAVMRVPSTALRLAFGEMAEATILASQRAVPERLEAAGYRFRHPRLADALEVALAGTAQVDTILRPS